MIDTILMKQSVGALHIVEHPCGTIIVEPNMSINCVQTKYTQINTVLTHFSMLLMETTLCHQFGFKYSFAKHLRNMQIAKKQKQTARKWIEVL